MNAATSDLTPRRNIRTAEDWLDAVIYSGQVTRITQHLALLLYHLADPVTGATKQSVRELEAITGWSRETIADRLSELEVFIRVNLGRGRAKTEFELQCEITDAVVRLRRGPVVAAQPDTTSVNCAADPDVAVDEADATAAVCNVVALPTHAMRPELVGELDAIADAKEASAGATATPDAKTDTTGNVDEADAIPDATADTSVAVGQPDARKHVVASQPDATPPSRARARANTESPSEISYSLDTLPLPPQTSKLEATVGETGGEEDLVQVNCVTIKGPNFTIDLKAIDQAAFLAGMPSERARAIAEIYAREWAANNSKPNHPMAYLRKMIAADRNDAAIAEVRLAKATDGPPRNSPQVETTETRVERMKRRAAEKLEQLKGGRA